MNRRLVTSLLSPIFLTLPMAAPLHADTLKERQTKIHAAVAATRPAVVCLRGTGADAMGSGSGVIVNKEGLVLTATHVVDAISDADDPDATITVILPDGTEATGKVLGRDRTRDAAMVQITTPGTYPFVEVAKADSIEQGEWCLAMGHPGSFDIQRGIPIRAGRLWKNNDKAFYRSDCTVSGGDSGGPLFDLEGKVIGIHSSISMDIAENRHVPIGVFHDEWERLKSGEVWGNAGKVLSGSEDLREKNPRKRSAKAAEKKEAPKGPEQASQKVWLGLQVQPATGDKEGVMVTEVADNSPAKTAGVQLGDVILKLNGKEVTGTGDIVNAVRSGSPGDKFSLTVQREGKNVDIDVTLSARPN